MIKKSIYILITVAIVLSILFRFSNSKASSIIEEEASPIREDEKIVGLDYSIKLRDRENNKSLIVDTAIISSISHYKDLKSIDKFFIDLKLIDKTKIYNISKIVLTSKDNKIYKKINYKINKKGIATFYLKRKDLENYNDNYYIEVKLER